MRDSSLKAFAVLALGLTLAWGPAMAADKAAGSTNNSKVSAASKISKAKTSKAKPSKPAPPAPSGTVLQVVDWAMASGDNAGLPFMVIDKAAAQVFVYEADGRLRGGAPALLGLARGDGSVPGIGDRKLSAIRPGERTTPAGRFIAAYGPAAGKSKVLWVDFATAISIHPVVTGNPKEQRLRRLSSRTPIDNRITYGCINVSAAFYEDVVRKTFTGTRGVVYILPEKEPLESLFPGLGLAQAKSAAGPAAALTVAKSEAGSDAGAASP